MSIEVMKRIKSLLQDTKMIDSHTISAVVAECDAVILTQQPDNTACKSVQKRLAVQQPATGEPVVVQHRKPVIGWKGEAIGYTAWRDGKGLDGWPHRELYDHPAPSVPDDDFDLICSAIDKADTITMEGDYMLDSDDCIAVVRVMQVLLSVRAAMLAAK